MSQTDMFATRILTSSAYLAVAVALFITPGLTMGAAISPPVFHSIAHTLSAGFLTRVADSTLANPEPIAETFDRLRNFTMLSTVETSVGAHTAKFIGLGNGQDFPTKQISSKLPSGAYYFSVGLKPNSDDIILTVVMDGAPTTMYLTNSKLTLRTTLIAERGNPHLITNQQAAAGFNALLEFWAERAKTLPLSP